MNQRTHLRFFLTCLYDVTLLQMAEVYFTDVRGFIGTYHGLEIELKHGIFSCTFTFTFAFTWNARCDPYRVRSRWWQPTVRDSS